MEWCPVEATALAKAEALTGGLQGGSDLFRVEVVDGPAVPWDPASGGGFQSARFTTSLDQVYGDLAVVGNGINFKEQGGIDFQIVTVLLPGGEEVPFTFSSKELDATADGAAIIVTLEGRGAPVVRIDLERTTDQ